MAGPAEGSEATQAGGHVSRTNRAGSRVAVALAAVGALLGLAGCQPPEGVPVPSPRPSPSPSPSPSLSPSPVVLTTSVKIFLVAVGDEGKRGERFGCGDSIVGVDRPVAPTTTPLPSAIQALLDDRKASHPTEGGLYNVFYGSALTIESATIADGKAVVRLGGELNQRGVCDAPRVETQLKKTAAQFPGVGSVEVFVGGRPLADVLSLQ